jgi:hypothetical protein
VWALATAFLAWLSQFADLTRYPLSWLPAVLFLTIREGNWEVVAPGFMWG